MVKHEMEELLLSSPSKVPRKEHEKVATMTGKPIQIDRSIARVFVQAAAADVLKSQTGN